MSIELALRLSKNAKVFAGYPLRITTALLDMAVLQISESFPNSPVHVMFLVGPNVWHDISQRIDFRNFLVPNDTEPNSSGVYSSSFYTAPIYSSKKVLDNILHVIVHHNKLCQCSTFMVDLS